MPATDMRMMKSKIATRGLVIPERIGEAVEDGVEASNGDMATKIDEEARDLAPS